MINTITINSATCSAVLSPLWQYDYGQYLKIEGIDLPQSFEVDFATIDQSSSVTMLGEDGQVKVPDDMLDEGVDITAYIYLHSDETDGYTEYVIQIPVLSRPERTEETPTPQEQTLIEQAIVVLNHAVEQTGEDVEDAQQAAEDAEAAAQTATEASQTATDAATSASASASAAATSASAAETSAGQAAVSATSAAASASTASTKAAEATTSAGTAATNATTALNAATNASTSATQAAASVTSAQTAQTAAEAAQTGAQTAQTAAESAAASAEAQADRAEGYADRLIDVYPTDTAEGAIASFPDGADGIPVKSLVVNIEPVQEGSGDPSPDNVRPITGWTGATVYASGADMSDPHTTLPITWQTEAGTVYGGTVDVVTGEMKISCEKTKLSDLSWDTHSTPSTGIYRATIDNLLVPPSVQVATTAISDALRATAFGPISGADYGYFAISTGYTPERLTIPTNRLYTTIPAFLAAMGDIEIVYPLATPLTYQLSETEVTTLLGQNNVWANCGDTSVTYRADVAKYIDKKLAALAAALS